MTNFKASIEQAFTSENWEVVDDEGDWNGYLSYCVRVRYIGRIIDITSVDKSPRPNCEVVIFSKVGEDMEDLDRRALKILHGVEGCLPERYSSSIRYGRGKFTTLHLQVVKA